MKASLIAPCGMNCRLCRAFAREKNACPGCRGDDALKMVSCLGCRIKSCDALSKAHARFCYSCGNCPCARLRHLDKRYRTKYGMSMIENLESIRKLGIRRFLDEESSRWACPGCGATLCVHDPGCPGCGRRWR